jgi:hypothetical protein
MAKSWNDKPIGSLQGLPAIVQEGASATKHPFTSLIKLRETYRAVDTNQSLSIRTFRAAVTIAWLKAAPAVPFGPGHNASHLLIDSEN